MREGGTFLAFAFYVVLVFDFRVQQNSPNLRPPDSITEQWVVAFLFLYFSVFIRVFLVNAQSWTLTTTPLAVTTLEKEVVLKEARKAGEAEE